jgi:hypothetical protein
MPSIALNLALKILNLLLRPRTFPHIFTKLFFLVFTWFLLSFVFLPFFTHPLGPRAQLDYLRGVTRPIWDSRPPIPSRYIVDFGKHLSGDLDDALVWSIPGESNERSTRIPDIDWDARCRLNGWVKRNASRIPRLWDVIGFNNDLELLEVRLHELKDDVVDVIVLAESAVTYTGRPKKLFWNDGGRDELMKRELTAYRDLEVRINATLGRLVRAPKNATLHAKLASLKRRLASHLGPETFAKIHHLVYRPTDPTFKANATTSAEAWNNEGLQRQWMYEQVVFGSRKIEPGDLMLTSDADEIPRVGCNDV